MRRVPLSVAAVLVAATSVVLAAIPNRTPEQLHEWSDEIVVGKVGAIRGKVETGHDGQMRRTKGTIEIVVDRVEKGTAFKPGQTIKLAYWTEEWSRIEGRPIPPHGAGHDLPRKGEVVRAFIQKNEEANVYEPVLPNGLVPLTKEEAAKLDAPDPKKP